jgi:hypothetical protein
VEGGGRPRREGTLKRSRKPTAAAYVDVVHHYTTPPDFPEPTTTHRRPDVSTPRPSSPPPPLDHYVKTSNRSRSICNGPLTPITYTHICNVCCLAPVTYKRARMTAGLASTMPVTNVYFW